MQVACGENKREGFWEKKNNRKQHWNVDQNSHWTNLWLLYHAHLHGVLPCVCLYMCVVLHVPLTLAHRREKLLDLGNKQWPYVLRSRRHTCMGKIIIWNIYKMGHMWGRHWDNLPGRDVTFVGEREGTFVKKRWWETYVRERCGRYYIKHNELPKETQSHIKNTR